MNALGVDAGKFLIVAMAISTISVTITNGAIFEPLVFVISKKSVWLGKLFSCHYCLSHWLAMALSLLVIVPVTEYSFINWVLTSFALVAVAAIFSLVIIASLILAATKNRKK